VDCVFAEASHQALAITGCGSVVVWSDVLAGAEDHEAESSSFRKEFIKSVKLSDAALRVIRCVDGCVLVCDERGQLRFYDRDLRVLFWCPSSDAVDSIVSVEFDLCASPAPAEQPSGFRTRDFLVRELRSRQMRL
jgi:hypothetical protein